MEATVKKSPRKSAPNQKRANQTATGKKTARKKSTEGYNSFKEFDGRQYTGMKVGRSHKWNYDKGTWKETKITPDLWEISYAVTKRRVGHAPEGSGVPVGTEYHWYLLAHQNVKKLNADDYTTSMTGLKYKLAHKRAGNNKWSASAKTQRKHLIQLLKETIAQLERETIPLEIDYAGTHYSGDALPIGPTCHDGICDELDITLNNENLGIIRCMKSGWKMDAVEDKGLIKAIGEELYLWFE